MPREILIDCAQGAAAGVLKALATNDIGLVPMTKGACFAPFVLAQFDRPLTEPELILLRFVKGVIKIYPYKESMAGIEKNMRTSDEILNEDWKLRIIH